MTRSPSPKMSSNASIFADRGDPWVSPREGREKFGRNLSSEQPGQDAYLFAKQATKADEPLVVKRSRQPEKPVDVRRQLVSKLLSGKRKIARPVDNTVSKDEAMARIEGAKHG